MKKPRLVSQGFFVFAEADQQGLAKRRERTQHVGHVHRVVAVHIALAIHHAPEVREDEQDVGHGDLAVAVDVRRARGQLVARHHAVAVVVHAFRGALGARVDAGVGVVAVAGFE